MSGNGPSDPPLKNPRRSRRSPGPGRDPQSVDRAAPRGRAASRRRRGAGGAPAAPRGRGPVVVDAARRGVDPATRGRVSGGVPPLEGGPALARGHRVLRRRVAPARCAPGLPRRPAPADGRALAPSRTRRSVAFRKRPRGVRPVWGTPSNASKVSNAVGSISFYRGFEETGRFEEGSSEFPRRPERETPRKFVPGRSNRRYPASIGIPRRRTPCGASSRAGRISTGGTRRSARRTVSPRRRSSGARRVSAYPETRALSRVSFPVVEASTVPRSGTKDVDGRVSSGTCARAIISRGASSTGDGGRTARRSGSGGG